MGAVAIYLILLLAAGCAPSSTGPGPAERVEKLPSGGTSALVGKARYQGSEIPTPTRVKNTTDPEHCGPVHSLEDVLVSAEHGGIQHVFVSLVDVPPPEEYRPPPSRLVLDNARCRFDPHIAVLTQGSILEATNSDPFFHSVHVYGLFNINVGLGPGRSKIIRTLNRPGRLVIRCDVHGWMKAHLWVVDHPYHSLSEADGSFRIENIPPGSYTVSAWHESLGTHEALVQFRPDEVSHLNFVYGGEK